MIKVFISQPMRGKAEKEIRKERNKAFKLINRLCAGERELIDSLCEENFDEKHVGLKYLSESIKMLDNADEAYFLEGWQDARGCRIEYQCCISYGIPVYFLSSLKERLINEDLYSR